MIRVGIRSLPMLKSSTWPNWRRLQVRPQDNTNLVKKPPKHCFEKKQTHANTNQTAKQRKHTVTYICIHTCNMYMIFSKTLHTHLSKFYIYRFSALVCFLFCSQTVRCLPSVPIQLLTLGALDPLGFNVDTSFPSFINIEMIWQGQQHYTSWKFNMAPENKPSQKESNLPTIIFQRLCYTLGVYIIYFWDGQQ